MTVDLMALPKAELHLHIEGTLEPEQALVFAERNRVQFGYGDADSLREAYNFASLPDFLKLYYACMATLQTASDFYDLAMAYYRRAASQGVRHAEVFFDAQAHTTRGVPLEEVITGLQTAVSEAESSLGITGGLILSFLRDHPLDEARKVWRQAQSSDALLGVGLDSAEVGYPAPPFAEIFAQARMQGLHTTAHAGEEGSADYVRDALTSLGVERIDHGIRSMQDASLVNELVVRQIPLTVCPLSNIQLQCVPDMVEHPIFTMLDAGLLVSVHSDDPAFFGGYIGDNFLALRQVGLTDAQAVRLARNSITSSFAGPARKAELLAQIDEIDEGAQTL